MKEHHLIQTAQKFGAQHPAHFGKHRFLLRFPLPIPAKAGTPPTGSCIATQIAGENDDTVLKTYPISLPVRQHTVFQNLQQHIQHIGVRFFNFIQQHHRCGVLADAFGKLTTLSIACVSGRRANQAGNGMLLHIFAHIKPQQGLLVAKQGPCQSAGQAGLSHTGRSAKKKAGHRPLSAAKQMIASQRVGDGTNGLRLADDFPFQICSQGFQTPIVQSPLGILSQALPQHCLHRSRYERILSGQRGSRRSFVQQINGLIRKTAPYQIAAGKFHRGVNGIVADLQIVVCLIAPP